MQSKSKAGLRGFPLRMAEDERAVVERVQSDAAEAGVMGASLNDVIRHLIRRAEIPRPRSVREGIEALQNHAVSCDMCEPYRPPRCLDGLYLRELNAEACDADRA